ncbi:hypothetical protein TanjilG_23601 [Lupinus angustifolius]|uniref:MOM1 alpha-helical domain-containing protein n=1 Tax=Lupinus angustifolius TaxID=3871 RepID=A0A4P1R9Z7_LUPAN|nr:PREDICTED: helicase protein MOM1-like [Lupinus angustifolius]OIW05815.1 hypothetical protein TanjilG_23601 [Lupinus angustifolius]
MDSNCRNRESERSLKRKEPASPVTFTSKSSLPTTPIILRRSERTKNLFSSTSSPSQKQKKPKQHLEASSEVQIKRKLDSRNYRAVFVKPEIDNVSDCKEEQNKMEKLTSEGGNSGEGKVGEGYEGNPIDSKEVSKDGIMLSEDDKAKEVRAESRLNEPLEEQLENSVTHEASGETERIQSDCHEEDTLEMLESRSSISNINLIKNCVEFGKGEKMLSSKRKGTMVDIHLDDSSMLVNDESGNLIADADPSRLCGNTVGTSESCTKRIRPISVSDVQRNQTKLINNIDQPSSKPEGEKLSTGNEEGKSGDPVERSQSSNDEVRKQQQSLHLLLKPGIAKLCEVLCLPDDVKRMVDNCLEYIMNNRQICTEPVSLLQAFQLSLCWTAAALLKHKLGREDSLVLAKRHLNFNCKIEEVNEIRRVMRKLKKDFLYHTGNCNIPGSSKASESSNGVYSNTEVTPKVKFTGTDISRSINVKQLLMQQEEDKKKLTADIEREKVDFDIRYRVEWAAYLACSPNDVRRTEKLKVFISEHSKRIGELKRQHEKHLKDLEAKQLEERWKFQESLPPHALQNLPASMKHRIEVEYLQTCDQEQPCNDLVSDLGEGKSLNNIVEAMTRSGTWFGLSEGSDTNSPVVVSCSSPDELHTPLVKHAGSNEMDIMSSEDEPVSRNKCHDMVEDEHVSQQNTIPTHSDCREQCSSGATSMEYEDEGRDKLSHESNQDICYSETSINPSGEVARAVHKSSNSNDQDEVPTSRQEKLDGTLLSKPVFDCSVENRLNHFSDSSKNMASLNLRSPEEHIPSAIAILLPNCQNAAQILDNDIASNTPNIAATLNSPSTDERTADVAMVNLLDKVVSVEMPGIVSFTDSPENVICMNPPLSMEQLSGGIVNVSISDRDLSRPCGTAYPSNGPDANNTTLLNQLSLEEQHTDGDPLSISAEQITDEVPEISHEGVTVSVVDREAPVGMLGTVNCTDHPENATPFNSSSMGQISDGILSSRPSQASSLCDSPATVSLFNPPSLEQQIPDKGSFSIPDGQITVIVPETNHEVAECHLTGSAVADKNTTLDHQEGAQPLSSVEPAPEQDIDIQMLNSLVPSPVDTVPANQSNHVSSVIESPDVMQQQSPSTEFLSSNQSLSNLTIATGFEHQQTIDDAFSNPLPETSIEAPNQAIEQPASNLELNSHMPGGVRIQSSDRRNFSTPSEMNNHPIQTVTQAASMIFPSLCDDPLVNEMERIRKLTEQNMKNHEHMKLQMKYDFDKEFEDLRRKYEIKFQEMDIGFQQTRKKLDTDHKTVILNKILADAFRFKCEEVRASGAPGVQQGACSAQLSCQLSRPQITTRPSLVSCSSSCAPPAASLLSSYTTTSSQNMVRQPIHATQNTSGIFSCVSPRLPNINSISSPSGNPQANREMRAPAPHLQPYRPSTAVPSPSLGTIPHGMSSHHAPGNIPVTSTFSHRPATYQSDPYSGHRPVNLAMLPTTNLPAMDWRMCANSQSGINMQNVIQCMSNMASWNKSRFVTNSMLANPSPHQTTSSDVVCLSDDD